MSYLKKNMLVILLIISTQGICEVSYEPATGNTEMDEALINLNKKITNKNKNKFIRMCANEFQVQIEKVKELYTHYHFTSADVLMALSIADTTGEPLKNISREYFENKKLGWKNIFKQFQVRQNSRAYKQILKDTKAEFIN